MPSSGLSGLSVGIITVGSLLVYAGFRDVSPLQALRDVSTGKPLPIPSKTVSFDGGNVSQSSQGTNLNVAGGVVAAAALFQNDKYSRLKRTQPGYSDCSSFVDKCFHSTGVAKPDGTMKWPNTTAFANSPVWKTVSADETVPGDIAVVSGVHMVMIIQAGAVQGIGQQNSRRNVIMGTMQELFAGVDGTVIYRTYVGQK